MSVAINIIYDVTRTVIYAVAIHILYDVTKAVIYVCSYTHHL